MKKPVRSISGILPVVVVTKPKSCKHNCIYCPDFDVPKSYTPESVLIAKALNYDPFKQIIKRLEVLRKMGHEANKIELIIIGGTFLETPRAYQYSFVKSCYDALNGKKAKNLQEAKKKNEKEKNRLVAFCVETRPDVCSKEDILRLLDFGVTRVELGVQAIDDEILKKVRRGHGVEEIVKATELLRDSAFKIGYHFMPGLPGSSIEKDIEMYKKIFSDPNFKPDHIKIYPTQVIKNTELERMYYNGEYNPYTKEELIELIIKLKQMTPKYCRIMRIMREFPRKWIVAGVININLRQEVKKIMEKRGMKCNCIRCREIGFKERKVDVKDVEIKIMKYNANKGKEFFIEAICDDALLGLIRLRFPHKPFIPILKDKALVRELHVYGRALKVKEREKGVQHRGIGKMLLETAENIAKEKYDAIAIISGVGVREYYRKFGYRLRENYMIKKI
jgi:elongator complex protein 3